MFLALQSGSRQTQTVRHKQWFKGNTFYESITQESFRLRWTILKQSIHRENWVPLKYARHTYCLAGSTYKSSTNRNRYNCALDLLSYYWKKKPTKSRSQSLESRTRSQSPIVVHNERKCCVHIVNNSSLQKCGPVRCIRYHSARINTQLTCSNWIICLNS